MFQHIALQPENEFNRELADQVHPENWKNPEPEGKYNLVVVGGGTAGLVSAAGAAGLGAKVALIERDLLGGDCLNVGCVPSKGLIGAGRALAAIQQAREFGVRVEEPELDFAEMINRMRRIRASISHHDSAQRFQSLGVDVYLGEGTFVDPRTIAVGNTRLQFSKAVLATGARASLPEIPGLESVQPLTNESLFSLTELPKRLVVLGGGPIGTEMAQCFALFGSQVTLIEKAEHILSREDSAAAQVVQKRLQKDGVKLLLNAKVTSCEQNENEKIVHVSAGGTEQAISADQILVSIGRRPNVDGIGLENAEISYDVLQGVFVNEKLQTSNPRVYAAGDICSKYKFTHAADFMARTVLRNALFLGRSKVSSLVIPWCTYTNPELAQVGLTEKQLQSMGESFETYEQQFAAVDRAMLSGETEGFVKLHVKKGTDKILGGTIVGAHAGEMISTVCLAMTHGIGLGKIASTIHPYPTLAEAVRKVGDQYNRTRLTSTVKTAFNKWLQWTR